MYCVFVLCFQDGGARLHFGRTARCGLDADRRRYRKRVPHEFPRHGQGAMMMNQSSAALLPQYMANRETIGGRRSVLEVSDV